MGYLIQIGVRVCVVDQLPACVDKEDHSLRVPNKCDGHPIQVLPLQLSIETYALALELACFKLKGATTQSLHTRSV